MTSVREYILTWSVQWISSNNCSLWDPSSRCDSVNAYSELLRSEFWISMLHSFRYNLLWIEFSAIIACRALRWRCRIEFSVSRLRMTPNTVLLIFLWHRFWSNDHKTFSFFYVSLSSNGFPIACFLCFLSHCGNTDLAGVLVRGFREVGEIVVRIVDEHHVVIHGSDLVELLWAHNLCLHLTWPGSQTSRCRCRVAHVLRFQDGKLWQHHVPGIVSEVVVGSGLEVTVREQQGWVRHEKGEGEIEKRHMCEHLFFTDTWATLVHTHEDVRSTQWARCAQKNVRATGECVHTPRRTHCSCYYMCTRPFKKKPVGKNSVEKKWRPSWQTKFSSSRRLDSVSVCTEPLENSQTSSFHVRLDLSCWYLFHQLAFHQSLWVEASRFPEACVLEWPTFLISWFSMMPLYGNFPIVYDQYRPFQLLEDHHDL